MFIQQQARILMRRFSVFIFLIGLISGCNEVRNEDLNLFSGRWLEETTSEQAFTQGFELKPDGTASSIGMATLLYEKWNLNGTQLILSGKSIGNGQTIDFSDEWQIRLITPRLLKLKNSNDYERNYYREE